MPGPLDKDWSEYREGALRSVTHPAVIERCELAFYAGALALWCLVMNLPDDDTASAERLDTIHADLERFGKVVNLKIDHRGRRRRTHGA